MSLPAPSSADLGDGRASSRRSLFVALALIVGGVVAFFLFLAARGIDPDEHPLGLFEWIVAGILVGPGFGYLVKWRRARDVQTKSAARVGRESDPG